MTWKRKKVLAVLTFIMALVIAIVITLRVEKFSAAETQGIADYESLIAISGASGKDYELTSDIDLSAVTDFTPIELNGGSFDGNGHKITGLKLVMDGARSEYGLFSKVSNATLKNLEVSGEITFNNVDITAMLSGTVAVGGIVGSASGHLESLISNVNININDNNNCIWKVGGIAGHQTGGDVSISGSVNNGNITVKTNNTANVGGIIGEAPQTSSYSYIDSCANTGKIVGGESETADILATTDKVCVGGIAGYLSNKVVANSSNTGAVSATSKYAKAGGLVGNIFSSDVMNSYSVAGVSASGDGAFAGGLAGLCSGISEIYNCYVSGKVECVSICDATVNGGEDTKCEYIYYNSDEMPSQREKPGVIYKNTIGIKELDKALSENAAKKNSNDLQTLLKSFVKSDTFPIFDRILISKPNWIHVAQGYAVGEDVPKSGVDYEIDDNITKIYSAKGLAYVVLAGRENSALLSNDMQLMADIDLSKYQWVPFTYSGNIDGNGYSIRGFKQGTPDQLIGYSGGFISIYGGFNRTIKNLGVEGTVYSMVNNNGGLIGMANCFGGVTIENVFADVNLVIKPPSEIEVSTGGLIGYSMYDVTIRNSFAVGKISVAGSNTNQNTRINTGGIIGRSTQSAVVTNSYANVDISASNDLASGSESNTGHISGYLPTGGTFTNVYYNNQADVKINSAPVTVKANGNGSDFGAVGSVATAFTESGEQSVAHLLNKYIDDNAETTWYKFKTGNKTHYDIYSFTASITLGDEGDGNKVITATMTAGSKNWHYDIKWQRKQADGNWEDVSGSGSVFTVTDKGTNNYRAIISNYFESVTTESVEVIIATPQPEVPPQPINWLFWGILVGVVVLAVVAILVVVGIKTKKFTLKLMVDNELYEQKKVKCGSKISIPEDLKNYPWFCDKEYQKRYDSVVMPKQDLTLFTTIDYGDYHSEDEETSESIMRKDKAADKDKDKDKEQHNRREHIAVAKAKTVEEEPEADDTKFREMMAVVPKKDDDGKHRYADITFIEMMSLVPKKGDEIRYTVKNPKPTETVQQQAKAGIVPPQSVSNASKQESMQTQHDEQAQVVEQQADYPIYSEQEAGQSAEQGTDYQQASDSEQAQVVEQSADYPIYSEQAQVVEQEADYPIYSEQEAEQSVEQGTGYQQDSDSEQAQVVEQEADYPIYSEQEAEQSVEQGTGYQQDSDSEQAQVVEQEAEQSVEQGTDYQQDSDSEQAQVVEQEADYPIYNEQETESVVEQETGYQQTEYSEAEPVVVTEEPVIITTENIQAESGVDDFGAPLFDQMTFEQSSEQFGDWGDSFANFGFSEDDKNNKF